MAAIAACDLPPSAPTQHRVRLSIGKSFDPKDLTLANINDDAHPHFIETDEFEGHILLRAKGADKVFGYQEGQKQDGLPPVPDSPWFSLPGEKSRLCFQIQGRFKREWAGDQVLIGAFSETPSQLSSLGPTIVRLVQFIDPTLKVELRPERKRAMMPIMATMTAMQVREWPSQSEIDSCLDSSLPPWPSPNGEHVIEDTRALFQKEAEEDTNNNNKAAKHAIKAMSASARRSYYTKSKNLSRHEFLPGHVYNLELSNTFIDVTNFTIGIGGFKSDLTKYWDGKKLRAVLRSADGSVVFFVMLLELVPVVA